MYHKVEICGVDTAKLPNLTVKEKKELFLRIKNGEAGARQEFINGNLRLVLSIIKKFSGRTNNLDDLFQMGCVGLIKALDNFDHSHGVQFSTYAVPMIIGEIKRYLRDNTAMRVSRSVRDIAVKVLHAKERFMHDENREPSCEELAKIIGVSREEINNAVESVSIPVSLYEPLFHENGDRTVVADQIQDEKSIDENWANKISLELAIENLGQRERNIVILRYFEGKTQMEVAEEVGISQAQVSRLEKAALKAMKKKF
jgi:RNA polymerase sporulation-specific sigma factor